MSYFKTGSVRKSQILVQSLLLSAALLVGHNAFAQAGEEATPAVPIAGDQVQVNVNEADAATIADVLVGIGVSRATAIVEYREEHGRFTTLEELIEVNGIGEATVLNNKDRIRFE